MKKKLAVKYQIIFFLIVFIPMAFFLSKQQKKNEHNLNKRGRYIVGETERWGKNVRSSNYFIHYTYPYEGTMYTESIRVPQISNIITNGGRYLVIFDPLNPRNSKMLFDRKVCECATAPNCGYIDSGWLKVPEFIKFCN